MNRVSDSKDEIVTNSRNARRAMTLPGQVRQHIGVTCRRHFVNRNPTLAKYTGMLVTKKGDSLY